MFQPEKFGKVLAGITYQDGIAYAKISNHSLLPNTTNVYKASQKLIARSRGKIKGVQVCFNSKLVTITETTTLKDFEDLVIRHESPEESQKREKREQEFQIASEQNKVKLLKILETIRPCDLTSGKEDLATVIDFSKKVSSALMLINNISLTDEYVKELALALIKLGCTSTDNINDKYLSNNTLTKEKKSIKMLAQIPGAIDIPAMLWSHIIYAATSKNKGLKRVKNISAYAAVEVLIPKLLSEWIETQGHNQSDDSEMIQ